MWRQRGQLTQTTLQLGRIWFGDTLLRLYLDKYAWLSTVGDEELSDDQMGGKRVVVKDMESGPFHLTSYVFYLDLEY